MSRFSESKQALMKRAATTIAGEPVKFGSVVYTKKRFWRKIGTLEYRLGNHPAPYIGQPHRLTLRRAALYYRCDECNAPIIREELHGAKRVTILGEGMYIRYCINCVVPAAHKPETIYANEQ